MRHYSKRLAYLTISFFSLALLASCGDSSPRLEPEVLEGEGFLTKSVFYESAGAGDGGPIQVGNFDGEPGDEVIFFTQGSRTLAMWEQDSRTQGSRRQGSRITLDAVTGRLKDKSPCPQSLNKYVDVDGDGEYETMIRGLGDGTAGLWDHDGTPLWTYSAPGLRGEPEWSMTAGDLDRDGKLEFYVPTDTGLLSMDRYGKKIWMVGPWLSDVEVFDPGSGGQPMVVSLATGAKIQFRDRHGKLLREVKAEVDIIRFELCQWGDAWYILTRSGRTIYLLDFDGKVVFEHSLDKKVFPSTILVIVGTSVRLDPNQKPYLAVLTQSRPGTAICMINIFSFERKLVYQERLTRTGTWALASMRVNSSGAEALLVADGNDKILKYEMPPSKSDR